MYRPIPILAAGFVLANCAPIPDGAAGIERDAAPGRCFNIDRVDNFRSGGQDRLYVRVQPDRAVYELTGVGCRELDFASQLGLAPDGGFGRRVCVGDRVRVVNPSAPPGRSVCRVRIDRALNEAEIDALPPSRRP